MMNVSFRLFMPTDDDLAELGEDKLPARINDLADGLDIDSLDGAIELSGEHNPRFTITDTMTPLVMSFCFRSVIAVCEEQREAFVYPLFSSSSLCVFVSRRGSLVLLTDDHEEMPPVRTSHADLLPGLVRCGERYLGVLEQMQAAGADVEAAIETLREPATRAAAALTTAGLA